MNWLEDQGGLVDIEICGNWEVDDYYLNTFKIKLEDFDVTKIIQ